LNSSSTLYQQHIKKTIVPPLKYIRVCSYASGPSIQIFDYASDLG